MDQGGSAEQLCVVAQTVITGTKFNDITGNGFSADDTAKSGVTIYLYKTAANLGTGTGYATASTTTTAANGTYSFNNLAAGTYYVQEGVPSGYIQTGGGPNGSAGSTYYTVTVQSGNTYSGKDFDDYMIPTCTPIQQPASPSPMAAPPPRD